MLLTAKIKTLVSTGSPDYNICSQATSALSFTNMSFKMAIGKNSSTTNILVNTTDLSTISGLSFITYTYGNYDIRFNTFVIDTATSTLQTEIQIFYTGTSDIVTWERFNIFIEISKAGYQSFKNTFELYNYDVGNCSGIGGLVDTIGNDSFEIILTNNSNNLDIYGRQTKTGSSLLILRRPFSDDIFIYNMIGTQGYITYLVNSILIGSGDSCKLISSDDNLVTQNILLFNDEDCETDLMCLHKIWFYNLVTSFNSANTCNNCTNNISNTTASYYIDASLVSVFKIGGVPHFLYEFMDNTITIDVLNYKSEVIENDEYTETVTYSLWTADDTQFLNPVDLVFVPSEIGDNILVFTNLFNYIIGAGPDTIDLNKCIITYDLPTCNWWTIESKEDCQQYLFTNCKNSGTSVTIQLLNNDKTFTDISTTSVGAFSTLDLSFEVDGIYLVKVQSGGESQYYSLPIFCSLQSCILNFLDKIICNRPSLINCKEEDHYNFNALIANAHTYFLLLNQELNYNYIYSTISADKVEELYTLKTFIDRFAEYCEASDSPCLPCNK